MAATLLAVVTFLFIVMILLWIVGGVVLFTAVMGRLGEILGQGSHRAAALHRPH